VRAVDRPSDDGAAFVLEWPKSPSEGPGVAYVVEVAEDPADFEAGKHKTLPAVPADKSFKSDQPKYFGYAKANVDTHFTEVEPARLYPPDERKSPTYHERRALGAMLKWVNGAIALIEAPAKAERQFRRDLRAHARLRSKLLGKNGEPSEKDLRWAEGLIEAFRAHDVEPLQAALDAIPAATAEPLQMTRRAWLLRAIAILEAPAAAETASEDGLAAYPDLADEVADDDHELSESEAESVALLTRLLSERRVGALRVQHLWLARKLAHLTKREQKREEAERRKVAARTYYCRLAIVRDGEKAYVSRDGEPAVFSVAARPNLFKRYKLNNLVFALLFSAGVLLFIRLARRNPNLFIRKIGGLEAVEEAIGRATEMGRPAYFVHGLGGMSGLATIASVNILSRVARRAGDYGTRVRVTNVDPIVTAVSQEVVQQAYTEAGRPDAYNADDVSLMARDQFSYSAAVTGLMVREQPAAIFLMGSFAAESLLLAETGASTGAIQIAGTDSYTQLPFFVTTCDYTLIGEELYAASAYLSREPKMLGSLRGQDVGKAFIMVALVVGTLLLTLHAKWGLGLDWLANLFKAP
jgi:hypothetical protein